MLKTDYHRIRQVALGTVGAVVLTLLMYSCANIGNPDGGAYDETPPRFLKSTPVMGALNNTRKKVTLEFDEYIKLEKASEKVVVSPPQIEMPDIKQNGKHITIDLKDSLKANTTYTIDFSDAIVDNNEGNPLGNFAFTFSTGAQIDTMEVSGILLEAANLEPVKGMLVGLHSNLTDSTFTKLPLERVARTDSRGHFTIRGIAPGTYRIFGLQDMDQDFAFSQKSEALAFNDSVIIPRFEERMRYDTIWQDTLTIDTIMESKYTHYLPDHVLLRSFKETNPVQYLTKSERLSPHKFTLYFTAPADTLPTIKGLDFDEKDAFLIEKSLKNDTVNYWIKDSLLYKKDTLSMSIDYLYTDTLGKLVPRTDTLYMATKKYKGGGEQPKKKKKKKEDEPEPTVFLAVSVDAPSSMDVYKNIRLNFDEPVARFDSASIHLEQKVDSLWKDVSFAFQQDSSQLRSFELVANWEPGQEYRFRVDSTAFHGLYGLFTDKIEQSFKVRSLEEYGAVYFNITGADSIAFVELLDGQDKPIRHAKVVDGQADFYYLNPGKYYARLVNDTNGNGIWDTGSYAEKRQPEMVYYYPQELELKANWELEQDWNVTAVPLDKQKLDNLKKQKPDEDKKKQNRNRDRQR